MSGWIKEIVDKIKHLSSSIDKYQEETVIQSLPSYAIVNRAKALMAKEKYAEAEVVLKKALELPQKDALVYKYLGAVYEILSWFVDCVESYQISAELNPQDKNVWQRLGFALVTVKKYDKAILAFENANKVQAGNTDTFTGWGMALMKLKKYCEAQAKFIEAIKFNKYNFSAIFLCAVMEIKLEMYDSAEMKLSLLANICPNPNNTFELARLKAIRNDLDSAIHYAKKALEFSDKMFPAYILLGQVYTEKYDFENAQKSFQTAEEKCVESPSLYLEWGKSLVNFDKLDDAKLKLLKAFELDREDIGIQMNLALCCALRGEIEEAENILSDLDEKLPDNKSVKLANSIIAYEKGDCEKAIEGFREDDENFINAYYLAKCYEKQGNDTKVKDYYEAAIRTNPNFIRIYFDYVNYLIGQNDYVEAQRKLRKALKAEPENVRLLNLMFNVSYTLVKDNLCEYNVKETISIAEKILKINPDKFEYPEQKLELEKFLSQSERE